MQRFIIKTITTAVAILFAAYLLSGIYVDNAITAILVALVMGLLNSFIRPLLIVLTIPITIFTFGLFLLFINVLIIKWTSQIVPGFRVSNWVSALIFSFIVSIVASAIERVIGEGK